MKCSEHPEREAIGVCVVCGRGLCTYCKTIINNRFCCPFCAEKNVSNTNKGETPISLEHETKPIKGVGVVALLICGIMVVIGVFLPWFGSDFISVSGWLGISLSVGDALNAFLVFIGGILILMFALPAFILSLIAESNRKAIITLVKITIAGALCSLGGSIWLIVDAVRAGDFKEISYGFWISTVAAVIGLVASIVTVARSKSKGA